MNANPDFSNVYAIIMAGGRGTRFWPAGRYSRPKQLLAISSEETMIEITCQRLFPLFAPENILVITNREFVTEIQNLLPIPSENVIGEPVGRDTASCVALAAAILQRRDPYATMVFLPADHLIRPVQQFHKAIINAVSMAISGDYLITFGLRPEYPACGYGYIEIGENIFKHGYRVKRFLEKPDIDTAQSFFNSGNYYWNCGIFVWTIETIINEFRKYCPDIY